MMNLGIGVGALVGELIADTYRPGTFLALFLLDAVTFVVYLGVVLRWLSLPEPNVAHGEPAERAGSYRDILRHRAFVGV